MVLFVRLTFEHLQNFKHSKGDGEGDGYSPPKLQQLPTDSLVSSEALATYTPRHPDYFTASPRHCIISYFTIHTYFNMSQKDEDCLFKTGPRPITTF